MLDIVKQALRLSTDAYDDEVKTYIEAGLRDLGLAGIVNLDVNDELIQMAVITYCRLRFGSPNDYDRLKRAYDEQKAQLQCSGEYREVAGCSVE